MCTTDVKFQAGRVLPSVSAKSILLCSIPVLAERQGYYGKRLHNSSNYLSPAERPKVLFRFQHPKVTEKNKKDIPGVNRTIVAGTSA